MEINCASVRVGAYLKKVWCSMQTFHSRFEARWLGSLKPMVLSNCSYLSAVSRGGAGRKVGKNERIVKGVQGKVEARGVGGDTA